MDIYQLLAYDEWATSKLLEAVELLSPEQFVHLLSVADRYRARMANQAVPDIAPESFATPQQLIAYHRQMRQRLDELMAGLPAEQLEQEQQHATRRGVFHATTEQTLFHMVNHATYHRGQIACLLKLHGVDFADTDFIIWINQQPD